MNAVCSEPKIISPTHILVRTLFTLVGRKAVSLNTQIRYTGANNEMAQVQGELSKQNDLTDPIQRKFHMMCWAINDMARISPTNADRHLQFLKAEFTETSFTVSVRHTAIPLVTEIVARHMGVLKTTPQALCRMAAVL